MVILDFLVMVSIYITPNAISEFKSRIFFWKIILVSTNRGKTFEIVSSLFDWQDKNFNIKMKTLTVSLIINYYLIEKKF